MALYTREMNHSIQEIKYEVRITFRDYYFKGVSHVQELKQNLNFVNPLWRQNDPNVFIKYRFT